MECDDTQKMGGRGGVHIDLSSFFSPLGWRSTANSFVGEDKSKYAKDNSQGMLSHPCKEVGSKGDVYFFQFERRKVDSDDEDF